MNKLPDISEIYNDPERALEEELGWLLNAEYKRHLDFVLPRMEKAGVKSVVEFGCGSGLVAAGLDPHMGYVGIDRNEWFLKKAVERNLGKERKFIVNDIRKNDFKNTPFDLSMAWAFLKHFALDEWDAILAKVLSAGRYGAFGVQLLAKDLDNGTGFHHTFVTEEHLRRATLAAGHEVLEVVTFLEADLPGEGRLKDVGVWTRKDDGTTETA